MGNVWKGNGNTEFFEILKPRHSRKTPRLERIRRVQSGGVSKMAEGEGFEPSRILRPYTISSRADSAALAPFLNHLLQNGSVHFTLLDGGSVEQNKPRRLAFPPHGRRTPKNRKWGFSFSLATRTPLDIQKKPKTGQPMTGVHTLLTENSREPGTFG